MAVNEALSFDTLALNDEVSFAIEGGSFKFTPAQKRPQWIDNPDADGSALAYEPHYTNSEFAFTVRIVPQVSMDTALAKWGELQAKLQKASQYRDKGGLPLVWTPAGSTKTYTFYVLLGEISEIPITLDGDLAGWFVNSPVIQVKLTCRPFGYLPERSILAEKTSALPLQEQILEGVGGDVPAEGRLIVNNKIAVDRRHLEWGIDQNSGTLLLTAAAGLSVTGFSGAFTTRTGAYSSSKVVRASAVGLPTVMCGTGDIALVGSYRVKGRVYPTNEAARFRVSYRVGDGPFKSMPWVAAPGINNFYELDYGEVSLDEVEAGTQRSEIRVEQKTVGAVHENDANYLTLIPTSHGYGKARAPLLYETPNALLGSDAFDAAGGGVLAGKVAPIGGTWSEAGDAGAFTYDSTNDRIYRTEVNDEEGLGHVGILGATEYTDIVVGVDAYIPGEVGGGSAQYGVVARYSSITKGFYAWFTAYNGAEPNSWGVSTGGKFGNRIKEGKFPAHVHDKWNQIRVVATADGNWQLWWNGALLASGFSALLATGGELAKGKVGIYDQHGQPSANTRYYDSFVAFAPTSTAVCRASKKLEVRSDETLRQDTTGNFWGPPPSYRGARFNVPVGNSRLALKLRRNEVDTEVDSSVTDEQGVEVKIAERFLAPR